MAYAIFLDVNKVPFGEEHLRVMLLPRDKFGVVTRANLFYNKDADVCFSLLDALDKKSLEKHHTKANVKCEWITEVNQAIRDF